MRTFLPALLLLCSSFTINAQLSPLNCLGGRYTNDVFTDVTKTSNIIFGYNTTSDNFYGINYPQTLMMDVYQPTGDLALQRPLIILAFGGAFIQGQRSDMEPICIALAKKGYVTATIDYRLVHNSNENLFTVGTSNALLIDQIIKASADMKAAIRYFKRDAATTNTFRIDTTKIIIGGGSSGAIAALQTAYTDNVNENPATTSGYANNGGFEGNTDLEAPNSLLPTYNSRGIAGVLNIAGGVLDTIIIDANDPPIYSSHGDADEVVPYNYGQLSFQGLSVPLALYGSYSITIRANNVGIKNELYTIPGGKHETPSLPPYINNIIAGASAFSQSIVCNLNLPVTLTSFNVRSNNCLPVLNWQTATELQSSHYDIETSADGTRFNKIATVNSKNSGNGASYTYTAESSSNNAWFRLKITDKDGAFTYSPVQKFTSQCKPSLLVYPNPAQTRATVSGLQTNMQVSIINAEGKLLWSQKASGSTLQIPLSSFANGLLLVQIKDATGKTVTNTRLIKN